MVSGAEAAARGGDVVSGAEAAAGGGEVVSGAEAAAGGGEVVAWRFGRFGRDVEPEAEVVRARFGRDAPADEVAPLGDAAWQRAAASARRHSLEDPDARARRRAARRAQTRAPAEPVDEVRLAASTPLRALEEDDAAAFDPHAAARPRRTVQIRGQATAPPAASGQRAGRRRPPRTAHERFGARPDRVAVWALLLGFLLILTAAATSDAATRLGDRVLKPGTEGRDVRHLQLRLKRLGFLDAPATARFGALTKSAVRRYQRSRCLKADGLAGPATVRALRGGRRACRRARSRSRGRSGSRARDRYVKVPFGRRTLARGMAGRDVRTLQRLLGVRSTGRFGPITQRAVRRLQRRAAIGVDGAVGPQTLTAIVDRAMRPRTVTWYGPGLYGRRTACGQRLTRRTLGVAHRRLRCGTRVTLHRAGHFITVRVIDRGPYANGATFDLTAATARSLGLSATERIRAAY